MSSLRDGLTARWRDVLAAPHSEENREFWAERRKLHPPFVAAVVADARATAAYRGDRFEFRSRLDTAVQIVRLVIQTDAFIGQVLYRGKAALQRRRVPLLPRVLHRLTASSTGMFIGDPVVIAPGVHLPHGHLVLDGITTIGEGVVIAPFTSIGLVSGKFGGPTIGRGVKVGTGARILGPVTVGARAEVGANAVVVHDVPPDTTVVGIPAKVVRDRRAAAEPAP